MVWALEFLTGLKYNINQYTKNNLNRSQRMDHKQNIIFGGMLTEELSHLIVEQKAIASSHLKRPVLVDFYIPKDDVAPGQLSLLLINDGQNLDEVQFAALLDQLLASNQVQPLMVAGVHAGKDRKNEYGTARILDYEGRGKKALAHNQFVLEELLPFIHIQYGIEQFRQRAIAGFSL